MARPDAHSSTADRELVITRLIKAPRTKVFDAWTDPVHVGLWWGPTGFTTTTFEHELKVGGRWRFMMHGPDGTDYSNRIVYTEIVRPERLAYDHGKDIDNDPDMFWSRVTFEEQGGKTMLTLKLTLSSAQVREQVEKYAIKGGNQTLDRFEAYLASL
jgi:uncharacterized protein YndB with AHSA1/START domain